MKIEHLLCSLDCAFIKRFRVRDQFIIVLCHHFHPAVSLLMFAVVLHQYRFCCSFFFLLSFAILTRREPRLYTNPVIYAQTSLRTSDFLYQSGQVFKPEAQFAFISKRKRKHRKRREQRKFRPLSPGVSPAHSQPSTLGHTVPEGRLPKVNSTGLWIGAPSLYSGSPSQAYYYGRPSGKIHRDDRPLHIPRAASETRIPQPMPLHPGAQRFYHSQQLAPVFEVPPTSGMDIYDVYQFGAVGDLVY
ncbi:hypothetical protein RRG08_001742 [Elysia crispata]|uniref:Uncharacterized protein n=1 Tax=Elysia crispata TaxID=231223 RepID=A0AAE1AK82_9GAST|nr:hypothetical protein RRG08_001742 [Elysia crispata]